jgi:hypothetical protein
MLYSFYIFLLESDDPILQLVISGNTSTQVLEIRSEWQSLVEHTTSLMTLDSVLMCCASLVAQWCV